MEKKPMSFEFEINKGNDILTIYYQDENESEVDISLSKYYMWVKGNGYHEWIHNYYNPAEENGHAQDIGEYDFDEYFDLPYETLKKHLTNYLKKRLTE